MASFDITHDRSIARSANLTVGNNAQNSALVDMQGFEGLEVFANTNTITAFGAGITFKLQHSDSTVAGTFEDVPAADLLGAGITAVAADADDDKLMPGSIGYRGTKRYVRAVATGGASTNGVLFFIFMRGRPTTSQPVAKNFTLTSAT